METERNTEETSTLTSTGIQQTGGGPAISSRGVGLQHLSSVSASASTVAASTLEKHRERERVAASPVDMG